MTTPEEPRIPATGTSDTGWPVETGQPPPPLEPEPAAELDLEPEPEQEPEPATEPEPEYPVAASEDPSVEDAPVFGRSEDELVEPEPEPELPEPEPEPVTPATEPDYPVAASEDPSVEDAPVFGRSEEELVETETEPEPVPAEAVAAEPEQEPETGLEPWAADPQLEPETELQPVAGEPEPTAVEAVAVDEVPVPRGGISAAVVALVLTTVLMALANGFVWYRVHQHSAADTARRAGLEASRDAARVLFSYDYRELDKDFAAGRRLTANGPTKEERFKDQYAETTAKVVSAVAKEKKAVVKAEVVTAGVVSASPGKVVTIVYVNQVTTSSLAAAPKVDLSRVRMTMRKVDGHWLVSKVDAL
jgi:Mce-associated membrane protein